MGNFVSDLPGFRFCKGTVLSIGCVQRLKITTHTSLDLTNPSFQLSFREVPVARIHCFELSAINRSSSMSEQTKASAHNNELRTCLLDGGTIIFAKVSDRLEVWRKLSCQPHQLNIAIGFTFEAAA